MAAGKKPLLGSGMRKLQPKLRMVANGSSTVNAVRATRSSCVAIKGPIPDEIGAKVTGSVHAPVAPDRLPTKADRKHLHRLASNVIANVFIHTVDPHDP